MQTSKPQPYLLALSSLALALVIIAPTSAADIDVNINIPGLNQLGQPVHQQVRPIYGQPQSEIVQSQPVYSERYDDSEMHCKKDRCKWKKEKKHKHYKHDHDD